jgi:hypothetical protein
MQATPLKPLMFTELAALAVMALLTLYYAGIAGVFRVI